MSDTLHAMRQPRRHRSVLAVPGSSMEMIRKAATSAADIVFLDCEDTVAAPRTATARRNIVTALNEIDWRAYGKSVGVRINGLDTPFMYRDVVEIMEQAGDRLDTILVPRVGAAADLHAVGALVRQIEAAMGFSTRVGLEALIETAAGMADVEAIAASGGRLEALHFGAADYADSLRAPKPSIGGATLDYPCDRWHAALSQMILVSRAYGLRAIDGAFGDLSDPEGYRAGARCAAALGAEGKWAIHPRQIALANEVFSPAAADVSRAHRIVAAMREAQARGQGVASLDNTMIDAASRRMAATVIARDEAIRTHTAQSTAA